MKITVPVKHFNRLLLIGCVLGAAPLVRAINYTNADLLLVFRKDGFNDVEFDAGAVSTYLGVTNGTQKTLNFDLALVKDNFNGSLADVKFLLVAATGLDATQPRIWLSDVSASPAPTDVTLSKFSQIRSKISSVGQQASILTASNALPAVIAASQPGSFTYVVSDGNLTPAASLGGLTGFPVEAAIPGGLSFYELKISTTTPRPPASLMGRFALDAAGTLSFTAGGSATVTAPTISGVQRNGTTTSLSFQSAVGLQYQLRAASALPGTFTLVGSPVTGDGSVQTLSETSSESVRFYQIQANP